MNLNVTFGLELRGQERFDEDAITARWRELEPRIRSEIDTLYGFLHIRDSHGVDTVIEDQIDALICRLCLRAVRRLVTCGAATITGFAFPTTVLLRMEGATVTISGTEFGSARFSSEEFLPALQDCARRFQELSIRLDACWISALADEIRQTDEILPTRY